MKPQQDTDRIKRAEKAAKITAWSNFLSALGTGIVGMATEGYIPKTGTDAPMKMLGKIDEWDKLYNSQNREYQQLRLRALMGQQQGEQQAANMDSYRRRAGLHVGPKAIRHIDRQPLESPAGKRETSRYFGR